VRNAQFAQDFAPQAAQHLRAQARACALGFQEHEQKYPSPSIRTARNARAPRLDVLPFWQVDANC